MTYFVFSEVDQLEIIKKELSFIVDSCEYGRLDSEEQKNIGLVIACLARILNSSEEARARHLKSTLNIFEKLSSRDVTFQNYVVTEFLENIRFKMPNLEDYPAILELKSKYL